MTPLTTLERGAKIRRINTLMSACRLIPNREDILALWDARTYDELTDEEIIQLQGTGPPDEDNPGPGQHPAAAVSGLGPYDKDRHVRLARGLAKGQSVSASKANMRAVALYARCRAVAGAGAQAAGHRRQEACHDLAAFGTGHADLHLS